MTRLRLLVALTLVAAACGAGSEPESDPDGPLTVVATTSILGDVAANVLDGVAETDTLMPRGADPHSFQLSAPQADDLESADLVVLNGLGLEEGLEEVVRGLNAGEQVLAVGDSIDPIIDPGANGPGGPDPHFWTDPTRMLDVVDTLADRVRPLVDSSARHRLASNVEEYRERLEEVDAEVAEITARVPAESRVLVTDHHVFAYFARRYDFEVLGAIVPAPSTLASPSAADLADLVEVIDRTEVPAIFVDTGEPDRLARVLVEEAGRSVEVVPLFTESLSPPGEGAGTYIEMMTTNAERIVSALGG